MKHLYHRLLAGLAKQMMLAHLHTAIAAEVRQQLAAAAPAAQPVGRRFIGH